MSLPPQLSAENALDQSVLVGPSYDVSPTLDLLHPMQLARMCLPGWSAVSLFGLNPDVRSGSVPEDIWWQGGLYPWPAAASTWEVVSDSALDTAGGTGARSVLLEALDATCAALAPVSGALNGTTPVTIPGGPHFRLNSLRINAAGSTERNQGTIVVRPVASPSTILGVIPPGRGRAKSLIYTVPAGYTFYLQEFAFAVIESANRVAHLTLVRWLPSAGGRYVTEAGDIAASTQNGHNRISLGTPIPTPATTDLSIRVLDINGTAPAKITAALHGTLITNPKAGPTSGMT